VEHTEKEIVFSKMSYSKFKNEIIFAKNLKILFYLGIIIFVRFTYQGFKHVAIFKF